MKISTEKFKLYSTIINKARSDDNANRANMFINVDEGECSCMGENFNFRFKFDILDDSGELSNFRVDIKRFLALCDVYSEITIDDSYHFHCGENDRFKLYVSKDATDIGYTIDYSDDTLESVNLKEKELQIISRANFFVGLEDATQTQNMNLVRIGPNKVVSSNRTYLYHNKLDNPISQSIDIPDNISFALIDLFKSGIDNFIVYFSQVDNAIGIKDANDTLELISEPVSNPYLPSEDELENMFTMTQSSDYFLTVSRSSLRRILDFMGVFTDKEVNEAVTMEVEEDGSINIEAKDDRDNSSGIRTIESSLVSKVSEGIKNEVFCFPRRSLYLVLNNVYMAEYVDLSIGVNANNEPFFMLIEEDGGDPNEKVIVILLK